MDVKIFTDGASRGNPGPSGAGAVLFDGGTGEHIDSVHRFLGRTTNNVAEYFGLMFGLAKASEIGASRISVHMDSQLIVNQVLGEWKVKDSGLQCTHAYVMELLTYFDTWAIKYIPREQNGDADLLANLAIDEHLSSVGSQQTA